MLVSIRVGWTGASLMHCATAQPSNMLCVLVPSTNARAANACQLFTKTSSAQTGSHQTVNDQDCEKYGHRHKVSFPQALGRIVVLPGRPCCWRRRKSCVSHTGCDQADLTTEGVEKTTTHSSAPKSTKTAKQNSILHYLLATHPSPWHHSPVSAAPSLMAAGADLAGAC